MAAVGHVIVMTSLLALSSMAATAATNTTGAPSSGARPTLSVRLINNGRPCHLHSCRGCHVRVESWKAQQLQQAWWTSVTVVCCHCETMQQGRIRV